MQFTLAHFWVDISVNIVIIPQNCGSNDDNIDRYYMPKNLLIYSLNFWFTKSFKSKKEIEIFSKYPDQDTENPTQTLRVGFPMKSAKKLEIQSKDLAHFTENLPCGVNIPRRIFPKWHHFSNFDLRSGNCRITPAGNFQ